MSQTQSCFIFCSLGRWLSTFWVHQPNERCSAHPWVGSQDQQPYWASQARSDPALPQPGPPNLNQAPYCLSPAWLDQVLCCLSLVLSTWIGLHTAYARVAMIQALHAWIRPCTTSAWSRTARSGATLLQPDFSPSPPWSSPDKPGRAPSHLGPCLPNLGTGLGYLTHCTLLLPIPPLGSSWVQVFRPLGCPASHMAWLCWGRCGEGTQATLTYEKPFKW